MSVGFDKPLKDLPSTQHLGFRQGDTTLVIFNETWGLVLPPKTH